MGREDVLAACHAGLKHHLGEEVIWAGGEDSSGPAMILEQK